MYMYIVKHYTFSHIPAVGAFAAALGLLVMVVTEN